MSGEHHYLPVPDALIGQRADAALARMLGLSRTKAADLIEAGHAYADGVQLARSTKLTASMLLDVTIPQEKPAPPDIVVAGMRIIHEDDDIIVVDKPAGVAAHFSSGWSGPTVVGSLRASGYRVCKLGPTEREGIVHRLDVGTSGIMVVSRSDRAYRDLKRAFKEREVTKKYQALVHGIVSPPVGTIDAPIGHCGGDQWKMKIRDDGKHAVTHYDVFEEFDKASLVDVTLETGRTHQIRVHFSAIGHPLLGDLIYGASREEAERLGLVRQWLHASELTFIHPGTGEPVTFTAPPAPELAHALELLRS